MTPDSAPPAPNPAAPAPRRWRRRLLGFAVLLAAVVWVAPTLVAKTVLRDRAVAAATADVRGTVTVGGLSAGWFSAIEFRDVVVTDGQGRTVVTVPRVVTSKSLLGFLRDRSDLGEIDVHGPVVDVVSEGGSTNLEDAFAAYLKDDGTPPSPRRPAVRVRVTDGVVTLREGTSGRATVFNAVSADVDVPADRGTPVALSVAAAAAGGSPGTIAARGAVGPGGQAELKADGFPLESLAAVLRRAVPDLVVSGTLTAELKARWTTGEKATAAVEGTAGVRNLDVSGAALKGDRLVVPAADLPLKAEFAAGVAHVRVTGGRLTVADPNPVEFADVSADVSVPVDGKGATRATVGLATTGPAPGKLNAEVTLADRGAAKLRATDFPLAALAPVLRRVAAGTTLAGTLSADLSAGWEDAGAVARVEGTAGVRGLDVGGPWFGADRIRIASANLPLKAERRGRSVRVEKAELTCDVGRLSAAGAFDSSDPPERILDRPGVTVEADVDLAKLAAILPNVLQLHQGVAVREGKLVASLVSKGGKDGTVWDGSVRTTALKAVRDGKAVEWPEPLSVEFTARAPAGQLPVFDRLLCKSDFIALNAQGSAESVRAAANVYLDRLAERLGEFVDLGGVALSGEASAWVIGTRTPAGAFNAAAGADLKDFSFAKPGVRPFAEKQLSVKASVVGAWPKDGPIRLDTASAELTAGADHFDAKLTTPIRDVRTAREGSTAIRLTGDLARWAERTRGFLGVPPDYQFGGTVTASAALTLEDGTLQGDRVSVAISNARFRGAGLDINEPVLNATGTMNLNRQSGQITFAPVTVVCPALNVRDGRFVFEFFEKAPMAITGQGVADSDLNRLANTLRIQAAPDGPDSFHGRGVGPVRFRWQGDTTTFGGTVDATDFAYGPKARPAVRDPRLKVDLDGKYNQTADHLTLAAARVERPGLAVEGKGTWAKFDSTQDVDLSGTMSYDLKLLTPELRGAVGGGFDAAGKGSRPFALRGSLNSPKGGAAGLAANGALAWDAVRVYGFEMGPGEFNARVANGVGTVSPVSATFGGGRVSLQPTVKLDPAPGEVSFARGRIVEKAKLTPAVCAGAVGYALPVVANAAQAEGEVSFDLDENRIPLADFTGATLRGKVFVHRAAVSAGPVVSEIVQLLGEPAPKVVLANDMTVPVRVEAGRVHHENLTLTVNGYAVKTTGSVGLDGSLAVVADVPIPGTFPGLKNNPALKKALEGKVVKVPIGGTMAKPTIDRGAFNAAVAAVARDSAKDVGRDLLNRELERLLPGAMPGGPSTPPGNRPLFPLPQGLPIPKRP